MAAVLIFIYIEFMRRRPSGALKPVIRGEVERQKFIDRMDFNVARSEDWINQDGEPQFYVTRKRPAKMRILLPKKKKPAETPDEITPLAAEQLSQDGGPIKAVKKKVKVVKVEEPDEYEEIDVTMFVVKKLGRLPVLHKPMRLFSRPLPFNIGLGRAEGYVFKTANLRVDPAWPADFILPHGKTCWRGADWIYYDDDIPQRIVSASVRDFMAQTDLESYSSDVYATMQELSVVRPENAHATLSDTLEIERIKAQKKKQQLAT